MGLTVQELFAADLANSTQKAYKSGKRRYSEFCTRTGVTPFPTKKTTLSAFVAHLYREGLAASTVKSYIPGGSVAHPDRLGPRGILRW